jgi:hypothetical protein
LTADHAVGEPTTGVSTGGEEVLSRFGLLGWLVNARAGVRGTAAPEVPVGNVLVLSEIGGHFGGRAKSAGEGWVHPLLGVWARLMARAEGQHGAIRNSLWLISRLQLRLVQPCGVRQQNHIELLRVSALNPTLPRGTIGIPTFLRPSVMDQHLALQNPPSVRSLRSSTRLQLHDR